MTLCISKNTPAYQRFYNKTIKRIIGFLLAILLLFILIPLYFLIAVAIVIESGFPIFYRAERGGYLGKTFRIYKFRSMVQNADQIGGGTTALNDNRITKVGNFLRKTKLDETAQLINIIKGEMCFVGPRPELLRYTQQYSGDELAILKVRPGITDYSSLEFINLDEIVGSGNADEMYEKHVLKRKNELRIKYAREVSFATDARLFIQTVIRTIVKARSVVIPKGAKHGNNNTKKL